MKHNYFRILLIICLSVLSVTLLAQTTAKTEQYPDYLAASDYSDCSKAPRFSLPLDIDVTEDYWLKGYVEDLTQGVSAYLYSDTDFKFEVYISCFLMKSFLCIIFLFLSIFCRFGFHNFYKFSINNFIIW